MTKKEMIKILCEEFSYTPESLERNSYAEIKKILSENRRREKESDDDGADMYPNGRFFDEEDEDSLF